MMWGNGYGMGGGWLVGGLMMLLFWGLVIGLIVWAIVAFTRGQSRRPDYPASSPGRAGWSAHDAGDSAQGDRALQIARERFARGEINREQYDEIRQALGG